jgi:uncharacterized protein YlxW (UPF0749 family)
MKKREKELLYLIAFILFGMILVIQIKTINKNLKMVDYTKYQEELKAELEKEKQRSIFLKTEISNISLQNQEYLKANLQGDNKTLFKKWEELSLIAGLNNVTGKGIIITVTDKKIKSDNPEYFVVHAEDIVKILNELKISGAQAISVNDERILPFSEIVCTGPTIQINKSRYPIPFEIKAIGDQDMLLSVLDNSSIMTELRQFVEIDVKTENELFISAFRGSVQRYLTGLEVVKS